MIGDDHLGAFASADAFAPARTDGRDLFALLAVAATFTAVVAIFAISPIALEARGIAYIDAGGGVLAKFHPATPFAFAALGLRCLAARRPVHAAWRLATDDVGVVLMLAAVAIAAVFAAALDKTPVTPLVDTFVLPTIIFVLLRDLDRETARLLAACVALVLVANAGLAVAEFLRGFHLIQAAAPPDLTDDPTKANGVFSWKADLSLDWRAEALLGHPLVDGLVVGCFVLCLVAPAARWIPFAIRLPLLLTQIVAMPAFGARTALVLTLALAAWLAGTRMVAFLGRGGRYSPRMAASALLLVGAAIVAVLILAHSGFLDRTIQRFGEDNGSASTRLTMFSLFDPMSLTDIVLRPDKDLVATLQRLYGLEFGIESSWIGLILTYGLIVAGIVTMGILMLWRSVLRAAGQGAYAVCILYLVLVSVTASLSGKTTTFAMAIALVLLFVRKDASDAPVARRIPGV